MRNKFHRTKNNINRDGILIIISGIVFWVILMINLNIF